MAFAWIFEASNELGTNADWDSESDTAAALDFPHYSELARFPWNATPYSGAYCMRAVLSGGTADSMVLEGDMNVAANAVAFVRFDVWFSPTFTGTADDTFTLLDMRASSTSEAVVGARIVEATNVINLGIGETAATAFTTFPILRGQWYTVELRIELDAGTNNDGTLDLYVTRAGDPPNTSVAATQVTGLDQGGITDGVLGIQDHLATTTGTILFDNLIMDDARVGPSDRYTREVRLTKTGHAFVGPGVASKITLVAGGAADCSATVYDTDAADTLDSSPLAIIKNDTAEQTVQYLNDLVFAKGCYVALAGTNPQAFVSIKRASGMSDATVRRLGLTRTD